MSDIETNENGEVVGSGNDRRLAMLNAIGDGADRVREDDLMDINDDDTLTPFKAAPGEDDGEAERLAAEQAEADRIAAEQKVLTEQQPQRIIRKVNGQDIEITDELLVKAQKIAAADAYLEQAARIKNEALNKQKLPATGAEATPAGDDIAYEDIARAIQMGTEEEAVAALRKLSTRPAPKIDEAAILRKAKEERTFEDAFARFQADYKDIVSDPYLFNLAKAKDDQLRAQGDTRSYDARFKSVGDDITAWLKSKGGVSEANQPQTKQERKESAPAAVKSASTKHVATQQTDDKEESPSEVIAQMKAERQGKRVTTGALH